MFAAIQQNTGAGGALVEGTFLVNDCHARIMFDSGATHSFIARKFMIAIGLRPESLPIPLEISTPIGRVVLDLFCRAVSVSLGGHFLYRFGGGVYVRFRYHHWYGLDDSL